MSQPEQSPHQNAQTQADAMSSPAIDLRELAERVYRLMQADLRLSRIRGEQVSRGGRR